MPRAGGDPRGRVGCRYAARRRSSAWAASRRTVRQRDVLIPSAAASSVSVTSGRSALIRAASATVSAGVRRAFGAEPFLFAPAAAALLVLLPERPSLDRSPADAGAVRGWRVTVGLNDGSFAPSPAPALGSAAATSASAAAVSRRAGWAAWLAWAGGRIGADVEALAGTGIRPGIAAPFSAGVPTVSGEAWSGTGNAPAW